MFGFNERELKLLDEIEELTNELKERDERIHILQDDLSLEISWAEGEIEFWQDQCFTAEAEVEELRGLLEEKTKPWWRYVIS